MAEAVLTFKVNDDGSIDTQVAKIEQALRRAQKTANDVASQIANPYSKAAEQVQRVAEIQQKLFGGTASAVDAASGAADRHTLSVRHMRGAIMTVTEALGEQNSALASAGAHMAMFSRMMEELPTGMGVAAVAIVGVGAAVIAHLNILEEARARAATLRRAVSQSDTSKIRGGMEEASATMENIEAEGTFSVGTLMDWGRKMVFAETRWEAAKEKLDDYRQALERLLPVEKAIADAGYAQKAAELRLADIERQFGSASSAGTLSHTGVMGYEKQELRALQDWIQSGKTQISAQSRRDVNVALSRGALEGGAEIQMIRDKSAKDLLLLEETTGQKRLQIIDRNLQARRELAKQEIALDEATAKDMMARRLAAIEIGASAENAIREAQLRMELANMSPDQLARYGPGAEAANTWAGLASVQDTSATRVRDMERTQTQIKAVMQGYLASGLMLQRDYDDKVRAMDQELTMAKIQGLQQYESALGSALAKAAGDYQKYTEQVRTLDKAIRDTKRSTANDLAEIKEAGMSPAEAQADKERRANEALTDAMQLSGQEQVDALRAVQNEYKALGLEAARAAKAAKDAGKTTADSFDMAGNDWRTTPGKHSEAFNQAWATKPGDVGSAEWWAGGAWGNNAWSKSSDMAQQQAAQTAADKVQYIGNLIVKAQEAQKNAAQDAATEARHMVDSLTLAANEAARLAASLASAQVGALGAAAAASAQQAQVPITWDMYGRPIYDASKVAETQANNAAFVNAERNLSAEGSDAGLPTPGGSYAGGGSSEPQMAGGGMILGPRGAPRRIVAHGDEGVFTPGQMAALGRAISGGGGGSDSLIQVHFNIDGKRFISSVKIPLRQAIATGEIQVN